MQQMAKDATKLLYAGDGEIFLGPTGTTMPTDVATGLNVAFLGLGFMAEDGVAITADIASNDVMAWQSPDPIDNRITARSISIQGGVLQFNQQTYKLLFGGGAWVTAAVSTFTVASGSTTDYYAMVVETTEATKKQRFCFPRVSVADTGELNLRRAEPGNAAVSFRATNSGTAATMTIVTDVASLMS